MLKIEYEIKLNNTDDGERPYISLADDYENKPEDRFFALEIARYILTDTLNRNQGKLDKNTVDYMMTSISTLEIISDEVAKLIYESMKLQGESSTLLGNYSFSVKDLDELYSLNYNGIIRNEKIFFREEGLKVYVSLEEKIYVLTDGIDNEHWKSI
jgi:hypothetical protein